MIPISLDKFFIHSGNNDVTNGKPINIKIKKAVNLIDETNPVIQVIKSRLIYREDHEANDKIASVNNQLETYCNSKTYCL